MGWRINWLDFTGVRNRQQLSIDFAAASRQHSHGCFGRTRGVSYSMQRRNTDTWAVERFRESFDRSQTNPQSSKTAWSGGGCKEVYIAQRNAGRLQHRMDIFQKTIGMRDQRFTGHGGQ